MTQPTFIIIGAAKAGTSAIYRYLQQHPDIFMSRVKEPMYFAYADAPPRTTGPGDFANTAITKWSEYVALFDNVGQAKAIGEASPVYLYQPGTAERIADRLPHVKLIVILRQPAERAFSAYMHKRRDGHEPITSFRQALSAESERIAANYGPLWHYVQMGYYARQLARFQAQFTPDQIGVWLYDDLRADAVGVTQAIYRFLGVDDAFFPDTSLRVNASGTPKRPWLARFYHRLFAESNPVKSLAQRTLPESVRWRFTTRVRNQNLQRTKIDSADWNYLTDLYRDDIAYLQQLLKRDLSLWLTPRS